MSSVPSSDRPPASRSERIAREVLGWPGIEAAPHRFGGVEFRLGKREIGHLHGDALADLPFPVRVREELVREGKARPHHVLPDSGWVSYPLRGDADVAGAIDLFRRSYDRAVAARGGPPPASGDASSDDDGQADPGGNAGRSGSERQP